MFAAGVSCSDAGRFAVQAHHHHPQGSAGAQCVACHMPAKTYMQVDPRHDHAFRISRPDESVRFEMSNACTDCHAKDAGWAAAAVERWFSPQRKVADLDGNLCRGTGRPGGGGVAAAAGPRA